MFGKERLFGLIRRRIEHAGKEGDKVEFAEIPEKVQIAFNSLKEKRKEKDEAQSVVVAARVTKQVEPGVGGVLGQTIYQQECETHKEGRLRYVLVVIQREDGEILSKYDTPIG